MPAKHWVRWWRTVMLCALLQAGLALANDPIVIGVEDDWYPYSGSIDGLAKGYGVDLVRESFAAVGVSVRFDPLPYKRCINMTMRGELVACVQPTRMPETENNFLWPAQPLFVARSLIFARKPTTQQRLTAESLTGQHVGVTNGYEYGSTFDTIKDVKRESVVKEVSVFRLLAAGRVQYALAYEKVANHLIMNHPEFTDRFAVVGTISENFQYCAFSKKHPLAPRYLDLFNEGFAKISKNGTLAAIEKRW